MTCRRCDGLMVQEWYDDLGLGSVAGYEVSAWRCLNCGDVVDPVIAAHHHTPTRPPRLKYDGNG
jgi:hypothetical protein